jgi:uncharacterized membrane protein
VAISVASFVLACYAIAHLVLRVTGSRAATAISVALFALNPDVLYLQSTPMTEPLLFGLVLLSISLVYDWVEVTAKRVHPPSIVAQRGLARKRDGVLSSRA